jgi:hypothetical protein
MPQPVYYEPLEIQAWSDFEGAIQRINCARDKPSQERGRRLPELLFRGLGNSGWKLETTLERSYPQERCDETASVRKYYRKTNTAKPAIETLSGRRFERLPSIPEFDQLLRDNASLWLDMILMQRPEIYEYLVYLRHHGFPSPLLDWTASPYVAAFFAFDSPPKDAASVSVYALSRGLGPSGSSDAHMWVIGPYMVTHSRHLLQQCQYSMCVAMDCANNDYTFRPHQSGLAGAVGQEGKLVKLSIPITERAIALKQLELMNINAFSLFGSEDSLIRTVARRELLFRPWS